ncbi:MAG: family 43 glycosylhydrolase [Bacteroides sp.]|nr:family 43 glycosylhydrolase [Bacteroides sp.]
MVLDLKKDVSWADRNAWAPCIIEKKTDTGYKYYFYRGNGYLGVFELGDNMISFKEDKPHIITPSDGTFREGFYVFDRDGIYYFLWSENDTRSEDYQVWYGTSDSPLGPIRIPEDNLILIKDPGKGIYGTGHNSVLQKPGTDEWYIVFHRFTRPDGIAMGCAGGYNRETCIDSMFF